MAKLLLSQIVALADKNPKQASKEAELAGFCPCLCYVEYRDGEIMCMMFPKDQIEPKHMIQPKPVMGGKVVPEMWFEIGNHLIRYYITD